VILRFLKFFELIFSGVAIIIEENIFCLFELTDCFDREVEFRQRFVWLDEPEVH